MSVWTYKGEAVLDDMVSDKWLGFIYELEYTDGHRYIGQTRMFSQNELDAMKNGTKRQGHIKFVNRNRKGRRVKREIVRKENKKWRDYEGSTDNSIGKTLKSKKILRLCEQSIDLHYWETYYLMVNNALFDDTFLNDNVGGTYFAGKVTGSKEYNNGES